MSDETYNYSKQLQLKYKNLENINELITINKRIRHLNDVINNNSYLEDDVLYNNNNINNNNKEYKNNLVSHFINNNEYKDYYKDYNNERSKFYTFNISFRPYKIIEFIIFIIIIVFLYLLIH